ECLSELQQKGEYFSQKQIRACVAKRGVKFNPLTLNRYLVDFVDEGGITSTMNQLIPPKCKKWRRAIST
ncbi:MAG: hypothetical protein WCP55_09115, partial [Lentisphaerota bacterium]